VREINPSRKPKYFLLGGREIGPQRKLRKSSLSSARFELKTENNIDPIVKFA